MFRKKLGLFFLAKPTSFHIWEKRKMTQNFEPTIGKEENYQE
jgi:hypothetical protein